MILKTPALLQLAVPAVLAALCITGPAPDPVAMGTIELKGSTVKKPISTAAIPTGGTGPALVGKLVNQSGQNIDDVTIEIRRADEDDDAPVGGGATVSRPNQGGGSSGATGTSLPSGDGTTANVDFTGQNGVGSVKHGEDLQFEVDLTSVDGNDVEFYITPSTKSGSVHADLLAMAALSLSADSLTSTLEAPAHAHVSMRIRNVDRNGNSMDALSGELLTSESGISLSSVNLYHAHGPFTPADTSIQVNGNQFTITGFKELVPGVSYDLLLGLTDPPQESYSIKVTGTF